MPKGDMTAAEYLARTKGRAQPRHVAGQMNKTEAAYESTYLIPLKAAGEIIEYWFESITLRLAKKTSYTPDFVALMSDGSITVIEVKAGLWRDDARVKVKVAAEKFKRFRFITAFKMPKKQGGWWKIEELKP
jgi:hypothetical protein